MNYLKLLLATVKKSIALVIMLSLPSICQSQVDIVLRGSPFLEDVIIEEFYVKATEDRVELLDHLAAIDIQSSPNVIACRILPGQIDLVKKFESLKAVLFSAVPSSDEMAHARATVAPGTIIIVDLPIVRYRFQSMKDLNKNEPLVRISNAHLISRLMSTDLIVRCRSTAPQKSLEFLALHWVDLTSVRRDRNTYPVKGNSISREFAEAIINCPSIRQIDFGGCKYVDDAFLKEMISLPQLQHLWLDDTSVTSLVELRFNELQYLNIRGIKLEADSMEQLKDIPTLKTVVTHDVANMHRLEEVARLSTAKFRVIIENEHGFVESE